MDSEFIKKIIRIRGNSGKQWIASLPELIKKYEDLWKIKVFDPFPLSYNYVAPAKTEDNKDVVLKILLPEKETSFEIDALRYFNGKGAIKLFNHNKEDGILLLERAMRGEPLAKTDENKQINGLVEIINLLHKPLLPNTIEFPTLLVWAEDFSWYRKKYILSSGPIPKKMFEEAEEIFTEYPKEKRQQILLHGDLHTDNILSSSRGLLAIDPKGIIGEREFELGVFLRSPLRDFPKNNNYKKLETRRILLLSEMLNLDKKRIRDWAFASAVNGLVWFLEDEGLFRPSYLENAQILSKIRI